MLSLALNAHYTITMSIPDYQTCMLPFLRLLRNGQPQPLSQIRDSLADFFELSDEDRVKLLPSGQMSVFKSRVGWARTYLKKAGLIDYVKRGVCQITERGRKVLAENPAKISVSYLDQFPEFREFRAVSKTKTEKNSTQNDDIDNTPEESLESAYAKLKSELSDEVLEKILSCSPTFFEQLVVDLLVKMGYGGSRQDAGERLGQSGDGGIDGIIKEDQLGLDTIFLQAKRWQGSVGRPEIQKFVGALQGQRARKGVFITTSTFTADAVGYVQNIDTKVVLIDGQRLANLMIDFDVGVSTAATYRLKRIDADYFEEN